MNWPQSSMIISLAALGLTTFQLGTDDSLKQLIHCNHFPHKDFGELQETAGNKWGKT